MKISVDNFKTLKKLEDFEFKALNIITGVNSSGKSSFIQFLLLIKQTLERKTTEYSLNLNEEYIRLGSYQDIIYGHNLDTALQIGFSINKEEFQFLSLRTLQIEELEIFILFGQEDKEIVISEIKFNCYVPDAVNKNHYLKFQLENKKYIMTTNTGLFNSDFELLLATESKDQLEGTILFSAFFPQLFTTQIRNPDFDLVANSKEISENDFESMLDKVTKAEPLKQYSIEPKTKDIETFVSSWFKKISYIGPLREEPRDFYPAGKEDNQIGIRGEYAAFLLEKEADLPVTYMKPKIDEDGLISFSEISDSLINAVNDWICNVFRLAKKIYSTKLQENYQVFIEDNFGVISTINHVGFGISQVLPIVVEGLRLQPDAIFILEQPEIHLHPKIQALLFDFFYSLVLGNKKILIETHSDHLLVRMRRRIAEDAQEKLLPMINLIFVETGERDYYFDTIELTDLGSVRQFPKDFIEQQEDYRAIVKAQGQRKIKT